MTVHPSSRRQALAGLAALSALSALAPLAAQPTPLRMGLIPYLSPNVLVPLFQPLAQHFAQAAGRPVQLYSAPSIQVHVARILQPDFDILFTAPHFGRLAQLDAGYVPIGSFHRPLIGVIAVRRDSPVQTPLQLRGKTIAVNDRLVLNSILTLQALDQLGLRVSDLNIVAAASQNSALLSVINGDVDAAIVVNFAMGQIPPERQSELRTLFQTEENPHIPGTLILAHPAMAAAERERLQTALMRFAHTDEGRKFLVASGYMNVAPVNAQQLRTLDVYIPELRRLMASHSGR